MDEMKRFMMSLSDEMYEILESKKMKMGLDQFKVQYDIYLIKMKKNLLSSLKARSIQ